MEDERVERERNWVSEPWGSQQAKEDQERGDQLSGWAWETIPSTWADKEGAGEIWINIWRRLKYYQTLEELKIKNTQIQNLQRENQEVENKCKHQQNLYEAVRSDRNLYSKDFIKSKD